MRDGAGEPGERRLVGRQELEREPTAGHPLRGRLRGLRSLRVGSYRIVYQLIDEQQTVRVAAILHRSVAYRTEPR